MKIDSIQSQKIISGANCTSNLAITINEYYPLLNSKVVIITSKSQKEIVYERIKFQFDQFQCGLQVLVSEGEPTCSVLDEFRKSIIGIPQVIIGIGGGSPLDYAKAIAGLLLRKEPSHYFLEGIGTIKYEGTALPLVAIPTTAGTGSECTLNAVLSFTDSENRTWKKSIRHPSLVPKLVFLDPTLTLQLPIHTTLYSGLDAFSQSLEAYLSKESNSFSESLAIDSIKKILLNLPIVLKEPSNVLGRLQMLSASSNSGIALSMAGLGVVHGLAGTLGALTSLSHGHICASLLYPTLKLFTKECSIEEISLLSNKMKLLLPAEYQSKSENYYESFTEFLGQWLQKLTPISTLPYSNPENLIEETVNQFSIRNHPTPFSKKLAKQALQEAFEMI